MPLIHANFRSPWWMPGGHMQTLLPVIMRPLKPADQTFLIELPDGDQVAADFYPALNIDTQTTSARNKLLIVTHGLEGSSRQPYVLGICHAAQQNKFDVLAWNLRGCGDIDNRLPKLYYSGCSEDLDAIITWAEQQDYKDIYLAGYSLGGNVVLKWLGEQGTAANDRHIKCVATASVPVDLKGCVQTLDHWGKMIYRQRFVSDMKERLRRKAKKFPGVIDLSNLSNVKTLADYDEFFSAPLNGFKNADELYKKCSAKHFLQGITVPTLLVSATNDPFLSDSCFPRTLAQEHPLLTLELTRTGGHVGYLSHKGEWWMDRRFLDFFAQHP
jgi:predicted alpha/beta-fold hydrolase